MDSSAVYTPYERRSNGIRTAAAICLCYTLLFFLVGVWLHLKSRSFRWDGIVAAVATVSRIAIKNNSVLTDTAQLLALGHFVTQFVALGYGQGRTANYLSISPHLAALNSVKVIMIRVHLETNNLDFRQVEWASISSSLLYTPQRELPSPSCTNSPFYVGTKSRF